MAITINYSDPTPEYVINIPKADMLQVQTNPFEVRQLNVNDLRAWLMDLQDDEAHAWAPTTHLHTYPKVVAGVTLARVVEILDPYRVQFEDGSYNVNVMGGNSNVGDVQVKNQVGVNTANSAGLQDPFAIDEIAGSVWDESVSGHSTAGTAGKYMQDLSSAAILNTLAAVSGSTEAEVRTAATQADGFYDGMVLVIVNTAGVATRVISNYTNSNGAFTLVAALPFTPAVADLVLVLAADHITETLIAARSALIPALV